MKGGGGKVKGKSNSRSRRGGVEFVLNGHQIMVDEVNSRFPSQKQKSPQLSFRSLWPLKEKEALP